MADTIVPKPPKPTQRNLSCKYTEPASADVPQTQFRPIASDGPNNVASGPLFTSYMMQADGEYIFRARVYA